MALNIKNERTHRLARELAEVTGESLTDAVTVAIEERLQQLRAGRDLDLVRAEVAALQDFVRALPERDHRSEAEILGYDEDGLPTASGA